MDISVTLNKCVEDRKAARRNMAAVGGILGFVLAWSYAPKSAPAILAATAAGGALGFFTQPNPQQACTIGNVPLPQGYGQYLPPTF